MVRLVALIATMAAGGLIALQPPVNSQLARYTGVIGAAFVSTAISALVMAAIFVVSGGRTSQIRAVASAPPLYLIGGVVGAGLVTVSILAVRSLGAGGVVAATVATQLVGSAILDRIGVLGLDPTPLTTARLVGFALLLTGTALVVR